MRTKDNTEQTAETAEKEYKIGDKVYVQVSMALLVRCNIIDIDDFARKRHPDGYLFYDVDEPIGHSIAADEIYDDLQDGLTGMLIMFADRVRYFKNKLFCDSAFNNLMRLKECDLSRLENWRKKQIDFIAESNGCGEPRKETIEFFDNILKEKKRGEDWWDMYYIIDHIDDVLR